MSEESFELNNNPASSFKSFYVKTKAVLIKIKNSIKRIFNLVGAISIGFFRTPSLIFWTLVLPIILVLVFGALFGNIVTVNYQLPIMDLDDSNESVEFQHFLNTSTTIQVKVVLDETTDLVEWLTDNNEIILLVIHNGWGQDINNSIASPLNVYYDPSSSSAIAILSFLEEAIVEYNYVLLSIETTLGYEINDVNIQDISYIDSLIPGVIMVIISIIALISGLTMDIEEKQSGMFLKFATSPIQKFEWIFAKQIWQIFIAIIASTVAILFALIFQYHIYTLHPMMLLFIVYGTITFSGIAMILIRFIRSAEGVMLVSVLFTIPQIFLSGALIPISDLPQFLQIIARIFPLYYLTSGMKLLVINFEPQQFWLNFAIATSIAILVFLIGIVLTKWKND